MAIKIPVVAGVSGAVSFYFFFLALRFVPMVNVVLATNTAPLWIPIVCWVAQRVKVRWVTWIGIGLGFAGIVVILHPSMRGFHPAIGYALFSGLLIGILLVAMRVLAQGDSPYLVLFYMVLIATVMTLPFAVVRWKTPEGWVWWVLIGTGLVNGYLQLARVWALQRGPAAVMGPIYFLTVPFTGILGWMFWDQIPGVLFYVGAALVIGGGIWTLISGRRTDG